VVTPVNRLVTACPYSAPHVEAPDPDIIVRRYRDLGKDHDPAMHQQARSIQCPANNRMSAALAPSPQPRPAPTGQALPPCRVESKEVRKWLDNKPQLNGRLTASTPRAHALASRRLGRPHRVRPQIYRKPRFARAAAHRRTVERRRSNYLLRWRREGIHGLSLAGTGPRQQAKSLCRSALR
jgi:hypothetical protein